MNDRAEPMDRFDAVWDEFLLACTAMQKTCEHGWSKRDDRCIQCVIAVAVEAIRYERAESLAALKREQASR